ncbi:MAG TPA: hypothetical protein VMW50_13705, partial [Dehalococcoidia bacterium]|nr:hypothetical protein [Dehalococcoidia bacterium]
QKSQILLLEARRSRVLEAQEIARQMGNMVNDAINLIADEQGIKNRAEWVLSEDMTEFQKKEIPPVPPEPPPDNPEPPPTK